MSRRESRPVLEDPGTISFRRGAEAAPDHVLFAGNRCSFRPWTSPSALRRMRAMKLNLDARTVQPQKALSLRRAGHAVAYAGVACPLTSFVLLLFENDGVLDGLTRYGLSGLSPSHGLAIGGDDSPGSDSDLAVSLALHFERAAADALEGVRGAWHVRPFDGVVLSVKRAYDFRVRRLTLRVRVIGDDLDGPTGR